MQFHLHILRLSCLILLLAGCATAPEKGPATPLPVTENPAILQAEIDLNKAKSIEAEWNVRLSPGDANTLSLTGMLALARKAQKAGETERATDLAQRVIRFARLGVNQAMEQQNAQPFYPE